jgi:hypothetical protein
MDADVLVISRDGARQSCRAQHMACARLPRPARPRTAQQSPSSRRSSAGTAAVWLHTTHARPIGCGSPRRRCTSLRTRNEHLFPHLLLRCGPRRQKANQNNENIVRWWAREDSNLQPSGYERGAVSEISSIYGHFRARSRASVHVCSRRFIGQSLRARNEFGGGVPIS